MKDSPLVSVVTANYNQGQFLQQAIESVLNQDYENLELIVVDDGSTDEATGPVLEMFADHPQITIIKQANAGQTVAKNVGLKAAKGDFIGFCDSDNAWMPGKLNRQLEAYRQNPDVGVVYGDIILIDDQGNDLPTPPKQRFSGKITGKLLSDNFVTFNTTLIPHHIIKEVKGFDESLSMGIDYDLWLRISVNYDFLHLNEDLVRYRIWGGQMSHRTGERLDNFFRLMEKFLENNPQSVSSSDVSKAYAHTYVTRGQWHAASGRPSEAWKDYRLAFSQRPNDMRLWKSGVRLLLGK